MKLSNIIKEVLSSTEPRNVETMLQKYPALKKSLVNNLKINNPEVINSINLLISTPSTFEIGLANGQKFKMEYTKIDFVAIINGERFYLDGGADVKQSAQKQLNVLLNKGKLMSKTDQEKEKAEAEKAAEKAAEETPTEETPTEETPTEETPAEETPEEETLAEMRRLQELAGIIKEGYDPIDDFIDELTEEAIKAGIISEDEVDDDDVRDALYDTYSESDFKMGDLKVFKKLLQKYRGDKLREGTEGLEEDNQIKTYKVEVIGKELEKDGGDKHRWVYEIEASNESEAEKLAAEKFNKVFEFSDISLFSTKVIKNPTDKDVVQKRGIRIDEHINESFKQSSITSFKIPSLRRKFNEAGYPVSKIETYNHHTAGPVLSVEFKNPININDFLEAYQDMQQGNIYLPDIEGEYNTGGNKWIFNFSRL